MPLPAPVSPAPVSPPKISRNSALTEAHPEVECGIGGAWDKLLYGNHRFVVEVVQAGGEEAQDTHLPASAHRVVIPLATPGPPPGIG